MQTFKKEERLSSRKLIEEIFKSGSSFSVYPFKCVWQETRLPMPFPAQLAISVPKRLFRKASDRNLIRRRIREGYRKNKSFLYNSLRERNLSIVFVLVYIAKTSLPYKETEAKIILTLRRLEEEYGKSDK